MTDSQSNESRNCANRRSLRAPKHIVFLLVKWCTKVQAAIPDEVQSILAGLDWGDSVFFDFFLLPNILEHQAEVQRMSGQA